MFSIFRSFDPTNKNTPHRGVFVFLVNQPVFELTAIGWFVLVCNSATAYPGYYAGSSVTSSPSMKMVSPLATPEMLVPSASAVILATVALV